MPSKKTFRKIEDFYVEKFNPFLWDKNIYNTGCGSTLLGMLAGKSPLEIAMKNKYKEDYSFHFILSYLKKHNFKILEITLDKLSRGKTEYTAFGEKLNDRCVILSCLHLTKKQASYVVCHGGILYHNLEMTKLNPLDFLNWKPIRSFVIWKKSWA